MPRKLILLSLLCVLCVNGYGQTCNRQLNNQSQTPLTLSPSSCSTEVAPHTPVNGTQATDFAATVETSTGSYVACPTSTLTVSVGAGVPNSPTGECGGAGSGGGPVFCGPVLYAILDNSGTGSIFAQVQYDNYKETEPDPTDPTVGPFNCGMAMMVTASSAVPLNSTNCPCPPPPCPSGVPTVAPNPISLLGLAVAGAPSGWSGGVFVSGSTAIATVNGSLISPVGAGTTVIAGNNWTVTTASGTATNCPLSPVPFTVTQNPVCTGPSNFVCSGGGSLVCQNSDTFGCSNGGAMCQAPPPTGCYGNNYIWVCEPSGTWQCQQVGQNGTPIVIDTTGQGFHLTSITEGVTFQFFPDKPPMLMSWTDPKYSNGWLALDRNGDGKIDNGTELFGNLTPQPQSATPNGYAALAVYDDPANGGNGNGMIDPGDEIFDKLVVWIDSNHDGVSQPSELHSLRDVGVFAISLNYSPSPFVNQFGDRFRYEAQILDAAGHAHDRCYDVFLRYVAEK